MFKKSRLKPSSGSPKWGLEPKKAKTGGKMPPQSPGAGERGPTGPATSFKAPPSKPC